MPTVQTNLAFIRQLAQQIHNLPSPYLLYLNDDASGDIGGYKQLTTAAATDALATSQTVITGADQEIEQWATEPGVPALLLIQSGVIQYHFHSWQSGGAGKKDIRIYFKFYKRAHPGGGETLISTTELSDILPTATAGGEVHCIHGETDLLTTDRLVIKLFATPDGVGANPTLSFSIESTTATRVSLPAPLGSIVGDHITHNNYIHIRDEKAQNTQGGTFTLGAWRTRDLTVEVTDQPAACSLAANQFTLVAGTYIIHASAPAYKINRHQTRLYNITDTAVEIIGTDEVAGNLDSMVTRSFVIGLFTITASKAFEIQHYCDVTKATNGFGVAANLTTEVYTEVELWKVA